MAYSTDSAHSPKDPSNTGDITPSLAKRVYNNPFHPNATDIGWPTNYDAFVTKTNDQQSSVNVTDETHALSEVIIGSNNALYLEHRPRLGTSFTVVGDTTAVIDSGSTDYTHGIIYFSTNPTGDFTVQYLADPDKYYGEYLSSLQDTIHEVELWAGAGGAINEGIKNAEFWLDSTTGSIQTRLPNHIHIRAITKDIAIKSADNDTTGNNITIGNSEDHVFINAETLNVYRGTFGTEDASSITVNLTDNTSDLVYMDGVVHCSPTGQSRSSSLSVNDVTSQDTGVEEALKVYGNTVIFGDLRVIENLTVEQQNVTSQVTVINDDFFVRDNTTLGDNAGDTVAIAGDVTISGGLRQIGYSPSNGATFDRSITFGNSGAISLVDNLDPSYIAKVHKYYRPGGPDWNGDCINFCVISTGAEAGSLAAGYDGSTTVASSNADELIDSGATGSPFFDTVSNGSGLYYTGRYDDGSWFARILSGPDEGDIVRVDSFNTTTDTWLLSRALSATPNSGLNYRIINPYFCDANILGGAGTSITVNAAAATPIVGNNNGIIKLRTSNYSLTESADGTYLVYMTQDTTGPLGMMEEEAEFTHSTKKAPSDESILLGEFVRSGGSFTSFVTYRPNIKWDSTWRLVTNAGTGTQLTTATVTTFQHNLGGNFRIQDYKITIFEALDDSGKPDLANVKIRSPSNTVAAAYEITSITRTAITIKTSVTNNIWIRLLITV